MSVSAKLSAFGIALPVTAFASSCSFAFVPMLISPSEFSGTDRAEILNIIGAYTLFMLPFVGIAGVFVGLPVATALRHLRLVSLPFFLVAGAVAGAAFSALVLGGIAIDKTAFVFLWAALIGVVPGAIAAFIWWSLVERPSIVVSNG